MNGIPSYQLPDGAYTTWDRWQEAERKIEKLKNALCIMGINPDSILGEGDGDNTTTNDAAQRGGEG